MSKLEHPPSAPTLGEVLLAFYECLTEPAQLDRLMEVLTSWLDDEDGQLISPKLEYHADRAWRLLGELSQGATPDEVEALQALDITRYESKADVAAGFVARIPLEDQDKLNKWLSDDEDGSTLLLRVNEGQAVELVMLSRDPAVDGYVSKRSGDAFERVISAFVAESFDLTHAEFGLLKELLLGGTLREIADRVGKSWETVRSQVKSLTNKLGVSSQSDILRMLNQAATLIPPQATQARAAGEGGLLTLQRPDGRTLGYEVDGPNSGKTLVYLHGMTQGRHWPENARALAVGRGWQVVRISRAGRGPSSVNVKEGEALLQDHIDDVMAVLDQEGIGAFSIFAAADGFAVGYQLALQHPERVQTIVGIEAVPPILSREVTTGFVGKMKTFGLACLYAPKTIKFMFGLAMHQLERMEDRHAGVHPLIGVEMRKVETEDGLHADDRNFADLMVHRADGMWRDSSYSCVDWAYAPQSSNLRPRATLIHCRDSLIKASGPFDDFAQRIGAPVVRIDSYLPYVSSALPTVLSAAEPI
ncbi:LuxR C-terminal-related transcriptional regulator [Gymnodinialimonas hymeniacidonis]|uniref:LuxR C-terminal-related transcriptional regulator n=1 Tax=Gymnodinialimonas hymeniacidonis TaxID=3126508 RepID=UPI0034C62E94